MSQDTMGLPSTSMNIPIMNGSGKELDLNKIRKALLPVLAEHGFVKEKSRLSKIPGNVYALSPSRRSEEPMSK